LKAIEIILQILKQEKQFSLTEEYQKSPEMIDFRSAFSAKKDTEYNMDEYYQTFSDKLGFIKDLSIIDLICNMDQKLFLISKKLQNNTSKNEKNISSSVFFSRLWFCFFTRKTRRR
jgi:hypothetical protein